MIPKQIGPFFVDDSDSTMQYGYYYLAEMKLPFKDEKRMVRVWLPEDYDFNNPKKKYPVIYFADGQNLVNQKLCAFGCWKLDIVAHDLLINKSLSFIAVGIDSPRDSALRFNELNPPYPPERIKKNNHPYGDQFVNHIADTLRPLINRYFHVKEEKEWTAIAGSSMGGIMAFYAGVTRHDVFGFSLDFSPAFFLYKKATWSSLLESFKIKPENKTRFFLYVGGQGFEKQFMSSTKMTFEYLKSLGFDNNQTTILIDLDEQHNEAAWHKHLEEAVLFWLKQ